MPAGQLHIGLMTLNHISEREREREREREGGIGMESE
jgi:hypothetical protein